MLHGYGGDETVMWVFSSALPPTWKVLAFRGIEPVDDGGYRWHRGRRWPPPDATVFAPAVEALRVAVKEDDVLWIGFSQGAALALCCAAFGLPTVGVACLAGYLPAGVPALRSGLPVFWSHGRQDDKVPIESARAAAALLQSWHVRLEFCETDSGHKVGADCLRGLRRWLSVLPYPK
jgi:predicted esterase